MAAALFVALIVGGNALARSGMNWTTRKGTSVATLGAAFGLFAVVAAVAFCVFVYRMWSAINDGKTRMTPGRAVGFLFVPFYNLYWMFQVLPGWATDYNAYCARHGIRSRASFGPLLAAVLVIPVPWLTTTLAAQLQAVRGLEGAFALSLVMSILNVVYIVGQTWMLIHVCDRVNILAEHTPSPRS